jgi:predicted DsbA family dithiol-disulfide isomerase
MVKRIFTGIIFTLIWLMSLTGSGQPVKKIKGAGNKQSGNMKDSTMKVEIWSDVMCPFCYIGKRKFEKALEGFSNHDNIEIVWKSFQLNPDMKTEPGKNISQYLAEVKGWSLDYAKQMNDQVSAMAAKEGLQYNLDKAVVANSFHAHRFVQLAKKKGKGDAAEEQLFKAYFTDGKNIADHTVLIELGKAIGLDPEELKDMLDSNKYAEEVQRDIYESRQVGARGVPFFVFNQKFAVSGAQDSQVFLNALNKSWAEFEKENSKEKISIGEGPVCTPEGDCSPE